MLWILFWVALYSLCLMALISIVGRRNVRSGRKTPDDPKTTFSDVVGWCPACDKIVTRAHNPVDLYYNMEFHMGKCKKIKKRNAEFAADIDFWGDE